MGAYEYQALDDRGRERRGVTQGDTARQVRQQLREQGLNPLQVEPVAEETGSGLGRRRGRMGSAERALVIRQLAGLLEAGLPVEEALATVGEQADKATLRRILASLRARVLEGHALSAAMAEYPRAFPPLYRATIAAGEHSGRLDAVLFRLADYAEAREAFGRRTWLALLYPAILAAVALAVVTGLLAYVVPQVTVVFESFDRELPWLTRGLIASSSFLGRWGPALLLALGLATAGALLALRRPAVRTGFHRLVLAAPLLGRLARAVETARFTRTLAILVSSGVPLLEGLGIAGRVSRNRVMRRAIDSVTVRVREGASLHRAMEASERFPPLVTRLIAGGEKSGSLGRMLDKAADIQEREVETATGIFTAALEPLLILAVGGLVLLIVLAILLPIFQINQLLQ